MLNEKKLDLDFISPAKIYAAEAKAKWKPSYSWPSEEGQNTCWFFVGPQNCVSCVRLGEGGEVGGCTQVKQLFEDEIIVWLHPFAPMAHRGWAKQHNGLHYLISASASPCNDIFLFCFVFFFFRVRLTDCWVCHQPFSWAAISATDSVQTCQQMRTSVSESGPGHVVNISTLSSSLAPKRSLQICCYWKEQLFFFFKMSTFCLTSFKFERVLRSGNCLFYRDSVDCYCWWCEMRTLVLGARTTELVRAPNVSSYCRSICLHGCSAKHVAFLSLSKQRGKINVHSYAPQQLLGAKKCLQRASQPINFALTERFHQTWNLF